MIANPKIPKPYHANSFYYTRVTINYLASVTTGFPMEFVKKH